MINRTSMRLRLILLLLSTLVFTGCNVWREHRYLQILKSAHDYREVLHSFPERYKHSRKTSLGSVRWAAALEPLRVRGFVTSIAAGVGISQFTLGTSAQYSEKDVFVGNCDHTRLRLLKIGQTVEVDAFKTFGNSLECPIWEVVVQ